MVLERSIARAKLTNAQVHEIRVRYAAGSIAKKELGKLYGVTDVAIGLLIREDKLEAPRY